MKVNQSRSMLAACRNAGPQAVLPGTGVAGAVAAIPGVLLARCLMRRAPS